MRIGLFGGTFNPIHRGHLHIALEIAKAFPLDCIYLIPCATPPHKETHGLAAAQDRLKMIQLALTGSEKLRVNDVELRRNGPSYSVDTVNYFTSKAPKDEMFYMLVGMDAFLELDTWKEYLKILKTIPLIVMPRPIINTKELNSGQDYLADFIHRNLSKHYCFDGSRSAFFHPSLMPIYSMAGLTPLDISSTKVRQQVDKGVSVDTLVPKVVANYIYEKGLYQ